MVVFKPGWNDQRLLPLAFRESSLSTTTPRVKRFWHISTIHCSTHYRAWQAPAESCRPAMLISEPEEFNKLLVNKFSGRVIGTGEMR
jgi:hypothetical protein